MDTMYKFWKEYIDAPFTEKDEKIKNVVTKINNIIKMKDDNDRKKLLTFALRSYFDDLIEYMECNDEEN